MTESPSELHNSTPTRGPESRSRTTSPFPTRVAGLGSGQGRRARAPWHIPWAGWKDILWRVYASVNDNRLLAVAGGVAFYTLLATFPAVAAFVSLYGLIADASTIDAHLSLAAGVFPTGAVQLLHEQITRIAAKGDAKLGVGFLTGLAVAIWSANAGMKAIIDALNVVDDEKEKGSFVKLNLSLSSLHHRRHPVAHGRAWRRGHCADGLFRFRPFVASGPCHRRAALAALVVLAALALAAIYRDGPSCTEVRWYWLSVGRLPRPLGG